MNKMVLIGIISILVILSINLYIFISGNNTKRIIVSGGNSNTNIVNTNALTMMYETEAGSGEYAVSSDTTWPQDGYVFNETLSGCENGSKLSWDSETNRIVMSTSVSDRCYVYFDVYYEPLIILSVELEGGNETPFYINNFQLNKNVEIEKYVLSFRDKVYEFENLESASIDCISSFSEVEYTFYVITIDGIQSEPYYGSWWPGIAICP